MVFLHKAGRGRVVLTQSVFDFKKVAGQEGDTRVPKWGKTVEFQPMKANAGLRLNGKTWRGHKDLQDGELSALLMQHQNYGVDFIAMSEDGGEAELIDTFFESKPDGSVYCWVTDRTFINSQGAAGHKDSKQFQEAVQTYLDNARANLN